MQNSLEAGTNRFAEPVFVAAGLLARTPAPNWSSSVKAETARQPRAPSQVREDIPLVSAVWKDTTIATSDETTVVEGNHYLPPSSVDRTLLEASTHTSVCPIKGKARNFNVRVGDAVNANAAWTYPDPNPVAEGIRDHIAFWKGVEIA